MRLWQVLIILLSLVIIICNPKLNLLRVFCEQFRVYRNDSKERISVYDIFTFIVVPMILACVFATLLSYQSVINASEFIITVFSIVATLLLSFLAMLVGKSGSVGKELEVVQQTFVTITINIIYSIFVVFMFAIPAVVGLNAMCEKIFVGVLSFLVIKIILNIFMVLKRMFAIFGK